MKSLLIFENREMFHEWLLKNGETSDGVWLLFGKKGGPKTLCANDALEEALCFGWIDGQMQSLDDTKYKKYFARRTTNSKWSEKNKKLIQQLINQGLVTKQGKAKIEEAKKNGQWDAPKTPILKEEHIAIVTEVLRDYEPAYTNFIAMTPSVKKTYTKAYFDAKTDVGRKKRLAWMVERLNKNLKPM